MNGGRAYRKESRLCDRNLAKRPSRSQASGSMRCMTGYFDSIPHKKLMKCLKMRISDRSVLHLIRLWLEAPVVESDDEGRSRMSKSNGKGTPRGGVISPLLANIYLHCLDRRFHGLNGPVHWANARLIRYADDLVVLARTEANGMDRGASGELAWSKSE